MKLYKEISKSIPHSCAECCKCGCCEYVKENKHEESCECYDFVPSNTQEFLNKIVGRYKLIVPDSKDKKLKRKVYSYYDNYHGIVDDKVTTLDAYYVGFINDCLDLLRKGKPAYIFKIEHLRDIMRFEKEITVNYIGDGSIEVRKEVSE